MDSTKLNPAITTTPNGLSPADCHKDCHKTSPKNCDKNCSDVIPDEVPGKPGPGGEGSQK